MALIAALPNPTEPAFVPFFAALWAFLTTAIARVGGASREAQQDAAFDGAFTGTGLGPAIYVATLAADLP